MATFDEIRFPVHKATKPLDELFPDLFKIREFKKLRESHKDWEKVVTYICLLYDKGTDLIHEYPELKDRKEAAAMEAKFSRSDGKWEEVAIDAMNLYDREVYKAILAFLKAQNNPVWTEIQVTEQELSEYQTLRFKPITAKDEEDEDKAMERAKKKAPLMDLCNSRIKSLELLNKQFYGDHKDVQEYSEMITPQTAQRIMPMSKTPWQEEKAGMNVLQN